ncbi:hypothetical protein EVAR_13318_1 [Eumeta japonica]|uniref:Uncharacterized protein n=1 Tax=Eumeta variegata TaxID=151549 RepID=A0A4C1TS08_EUMVA|nr:hypothetical protein EVAR_13318_1 [Eumeta japonica]
MSDHAHCSSEAVQRGLGQLTMIVINAAVKLVTKASRWRKIGTRGRRRKARGELCLHIASFADSSECHDQLQNNGHERVEHTDPLGRAEKSRADPTVSLERYTLTS